MTCSRYRRPGLGAEVALGMALVLLVAVPLRADQAEALKRRFATEAPPAWEEYQVYAERLQGSMLTVWTLDGKEQERRRFERKGNPNCQLSILESIAPKRESRITGYNPSYTFRIERKSADGAWSLTKFRPGPKDAQVWSGSGASLRSACIKTSIATLPELVRIPTFRVVGASTVLDGGRELCLIAFQTQGEAANGTLLLDPSRFWTLRTFTYRGKESGGDVVNKVEIELRDPAAKYPIPKRSILLSDVTPSDKPKFHSETVTEFDLKESSRVPADKEFTLSAFGIPEPGGPATKRTPWYLWLAGGAALSALVALGLRYLRHRRAVVARA